MTSVASDHLNEGTVVDQRYVVKTEIGVGNMATVYLAEDAIAQRGVAIKVMRQRLVGRPDRERRFFNEDRFQAVLARHPNVVRTFGHGRVNGTDGAPYLVMEHVAGPSLGLLVTVKKRLSPRHTAHLGVGVARGLRAIHRAGIIHRDVKPDNVLVAIPRSRNEVEEVAKLADFGLAVQLTDARGAPVPRLTQHLAIPGSSGYIAPEATTFAPPAPAVDVFGLGMVLLEALTGSNPYADMPREDYLREIAKPSWTVPAEVLEEVPSTPLRELISGCTRYDPTARPSIDEAIERLESVLASFPVPVEASKDTTAVASTTIPPPRREGWVAGAAFMLLLGVGLAWAFWPSPPEPEPPVQLGTQQEGAEPLPVAAPPGADVAPVDMGDGRDDDDVDEASGEDTTAGIETGTNTAPEVEVTPRRPRTERGRRPRPPPVDSVPPEQDGEERQAAQRCAPILLSISQLTREGIWSRVPFMLKSNRSCFDAAEYRRILVEALARLGRNDECLEAANGSNDPKVRQWADQCKETLPQ